MWRNAWINYSTRLSSDALTETKEGDQEFKEKITNVHRLPNKSINKRLLVSMKNIAHVSVIILFRALAVIYRHLTLISITESFTIYLNSVS